MNSRPSAEWNSRGASGFPLVLRSRNVTSYKVRGNADPTFTLEALLFGGKRIGFAFPSDIPNTYKPKERGAQPQGP